MIVKRNIDFQCPLKNGDEENTQGRLLQNTHSKLIIVFFCFFLYNYLFSSIPFDCFFLMKKRNRLFMWRAISTLIRCKDRLAFLQYWQKTINQAAYRHGHWKLIEVHSNLGELCVTVIQAQCLCSQVGAVADLWGALNCHFWMQCIITLGLSSLSLNIFDSVQPLSHACF